MLLRSYSLEKHHMYVSICANSVMAPRAGGLGIRSASSRSVRQEQPMQVERSRSRAALYLDL